jgi:hypothetical protein
MAFFLKKMNQINQVALSAAEYNSVFAMNHLPIDITDNFFRIMEEGGCKYCYSHFFASKI